MIATLAVIPLPLVFKKGSDSSRDDGHAMAMNKRGKLKRAH
jgi:hypothetical protein